MNVDAIQTARIQISNSNRNPCPLQDGEVADFGKVALATKTVRSVGEGAIGREVELEIVVGIAKALDHAKPLDCREGLVDLTDLRVCVVWIRSSQVGDRWRVGKSAIVGVFGLSLTLQELVIEWNSVGGTKKTRNDSSDFVQHDEDDALPDLVHVSKGESDGQSRRAFYAILIPHIEIQTSNDQRSQPSPVCPGMDQETVDGDSGL